MAKVDTGAIERGLALLARQQLFTPNEVQVIVAAGAALQARGEPYTRTEGKLLDAAEAMGRWGRPAPRDPWPATPELDAQIAQAEAALTQADAELAAAREAHERAIAERERIVGVAQRQAAREPQGVGIATITGAEYATTRTLAEYERALKVADAHWLLCRGRVTSLQLIRDAERARLSATYHHSGR